MAALSNPRREKFAQAVAAGMRVEDAYVAAGYAAGTRNGYRLRQRDEVRTRIDELTEVAAKKAVDTIAEAAVKAVATREWVREKLVSNVERSMQAEPVRDAKGNVTGTYRYQAKSQIGPSSSSARNWGCFETTSPTVRGRGKPSSSSSMAATNWCR